MPKTLIAPALLGALLIAAAEISAQDRERRPTFDGSAVVRVDDAEYTIPILCEDAARPEMGFFTEPSRVTRERTGRTSMISLRVRSSGEPNELVVALDRYVAWMPQGSSSGGVMTAEIDMSPASMVRNNMPTALTRDMWFDGDRPEGLTGVWFEAHCGVRDPGAPSFRKIPGPGR